MYTSGIICVLISIGFYWTRCILRSFLHHFFYQVKFDWRILRHCTSREFRLPEKVFFLVLKCAGAYHGSMRRLFFYICGSISFKKTPYFTMFSFWRILGYSTWRSPPPCFAWDNMLFVLPMSALGREAKRDSVLA